VDILGLKSPSCPDMVEDGMICIVGVLADDARRLAGLGDMYSVKLPNEDVRASPA